MKTAIQHRNAGLLYRHEFAVQVNHELPPAKFAVKQAQAMPAAE
jgi:hypothetical protein